MKQKYFFLMAILVAFVAQAADKPDRYMHLLRDGVKWVYVERKDITFEDCTPPNDTRFYTIEMRGDTVIGKKTYKKAFRYSDVVWDHPWELHIVRPCSDTEPFALLRESGRTIYLNNVKAAKLTNETYYISLLFDQNYTSEDDEFKLYEFDDTDIFHFVGYKPFNGQESEVYIFGTEYGMYYDGEFVEGVGFDSDRNGDLLTPFAMGSYYMEYSFSGLHHMEDADGNVIYRGKAYGYVDMDNNQLVDVDDVNEVINVILEPSNFVGDRRFGFADVDCNGIVDIDDVNEVINYILK